MISLKINKCFCLCYQCRYTSHKNVTWMVSIALRFFLLIHLKCEDLIRKLCHSIIPTDKNNTLTNTVGQSFPAKNTTFWRNDKRKAPSLPTNLSRLKNLEWSISRRLFLSTGLTRIYFTHLLQECAFSPPNTKGNKILSWFRCVSGSVLNRTYFISFKLSLLLDRKAGWKFRLQELDFKLIYLYKKTKCIRQNTKIRTFGRFAITHSVTVKDVWIQASLV
jgi:hypothetical protein